MTYEELSIIGINQNSKNIQRVKCPKCLPHKNANDSSKDLAVNVSLGWYTCFRCGFKGGIKNNNISVEKEFKPIREAKLPEDTLLLIKMNKYFETRGISKEVTKRNKIEVIPNFYFGNGKKLSAICFKYYIYDDCLNIKYRSSQKDFMQYKGGAKILYKLNDIALTDEVIITEGEFDALSFEMIGLLNAVSVPEGGLQPNTKNIGTKLDFIDNSIEFLENKTKFYLALDNDLPGIAMREELARRFGKHKCWIINFPNDCKDANDVLVKHGKDKLKECYLNATPYPFDGILYAKDSREKVFEIYENGYGEKDNTGWFEFDKKIMRTKGQLIIITGIPSHGKTTFTTDWLTRLSINQGKKYAIFSPEHSTEALTIKLARQLVGDNIASGFDTRMTKDELNEAIDYINDNFFFIRPSNSKSKLEDILQRVEHLVFTKGINGFMIDSWMKLTHLLGTNQSETQYTSVILNELSDFSKKHELATFLIAHPRKMLKDGKKYARVTMYDINGSSHFFNIADIGISIYRDWNSEFTASKTTVFREKVREDYMGKVGSHNFNIFSAAAERFYEDEWSKQVGNRIPKEKDYPSSWDAPEFNNYVGEENHF